MTRTTIVAAVLAAGALGLTTVYALTAPEAPATVQTSDPSARAGSGPLDGMAFVGMLGPEGQAGDVPDRLVFADGLFVSEECASRCNYPASAYYVREESGRVEFFSETRCPTKDAKIVWRGTVEDGVLKGSSVWTSKRWYWTVERTFWFEGKLAQKPG